MADDQIALVGCALALLVAGGFVGISYPIGRVIRRQPRRTPTPRTVPFQVAERADDADRKAA